MPQQFVIGALTIWALAIAGTDIRQLRVPNVLLVLVAVPAALFLFIQGTGVLGSSPSASLWGLLVGFGLTFVGYLAGKLGAGDVKYSALLGFLCGLDGILQLLLIAALVLGLMAGAISIATRLRQAHPGRMPAALALSAGFITQLYLPGIFEHG